MIGSTRYNRTVLVKNIYKGKCRYYERKIELLEQRINELEPLGLLQHRASIEDI